MARVELIMPKMGESITEATIIKWVKQVGEPIDEDDTILEIATDKVDSEVPSPTNGVLTEILFQEDDVIMVGEVIAYIEVANETNTVSDSKAIEKIELIQQITPKVMEVSRSTRFYSPLVKRMAIIENIELAELEAITGTGKEGRVTKNDMQAYIKNRQTPTNEIKEAKPPLSKIVYTPPAISVNGTDEIIEMSRIRRLIATQMVASKQISPHVTSFVEADMTNIVNWRKTMKPIFAERYNEKITYTPIFIEAIAKAIQDFPMINVSVDGNNIIVKKDINIGMATAMNSGNLIVPVIKQANFLNLVGLTKQVNDLAQRARINRLKPDEIQGGTFTLTNVGTFGNLSGIPIINQPQVAILSVGVIKKKPAVVETKYGDVIAIRHLMMLSLSYDHRVVDGMLGGSFLKRIADYLEQFDIARPI